MYIYYNIVKNLSIYHLTVDFYYAQMYNETVNIRNGKHRVTVIIRTRQKCSIKAIFVAFAVALRQQGCHLKTTNLIFTPSIFDALQFIVCRFGLNRGKNAVNPFGLTSILTKSKGKSATRNRGLDYHRNPNRFYKILKG